MVLIVNCQNGYMDKCPSQILRNIVDAADLMENVWMLTWKNPPDDSFHKKVNWASMRKDIEFALYSELEQLGKRVHPMRFPQDFSPEMNETLKASPEIYIIGANTSDWLVEIASEIWGVHRIMPRFIYDAWFTVGEKGAHMRAVSTLTRQFGANTFFSWETIKAPIIKRREELARLFLEAEAKAQKSVETAGAPPQASA